jgi:hypothetical protein
MNPSTEELLRVAQLAAHYRWLSKHGRGEDDQMELADTGRKLDIAIEQAKEAGVL